MSVTAMQLLVAFQSGTCVHLGSMTGQAFNALMRDLAKLRERQRGVS